MSIYNLKYQDKEFNSPYLGTYDEDFDEIPLDVCESLVLTDQDLFNEDGDSIGSVDIYLYRVGSFVSCRLLNLTFTPTDDETNTVSTGEIFPSNYKSGNSGDFDLGNFWVENSEDVTDYEQPEFLLINNDDDTAAFLEIQLLRSDNYSDGVTYQLGGSCDVLQLNWYYDDNPP